MDKIQQIAQQIEVAKTTHKLILTSKFEGKDSVSVYKSLEWLNSVINVMLKEQNKLMEEKNELEKANNSASSTSGETKPV